MKVTELSIKARMFESKYWDKSFATESGMLIRFVEIDGWLRVMLEIDERTTNQNIREAAPLLLEWRDRLIDFQGAWNGGGENHFFERLSDMQKHGYSYARLAERLNKQIEKHLNGYIAYRQEVDAIHPEEKNKHDKDIFYNIFWLGMKSNSSSLTHAQGVLESLHYKKEDILEIIKDGLESLANGKSIFSKDYPISKFKMIEALRTWRSGKLHLAIQKQEEIARQEYEKQKNDKG